MSPLPILVFIFAIKITVRVSEAPGAFETAITVITAITAKTATVLSGVVTGALGTVGLAGEVKGILFVHGGFREATHTSNHRSQAIKDSI